MSFLRSLSNRLRSLVRKEHVEGELDEELRDYLEMAAEEKIREGMNRKGCASRCAFGARKP